MRVTLWTHGDVDEGQNMILLTDRGSPDKAIAALVPIMQRYGLPISMRRIAAWRPGAKDQRAPSTRRESPGPTTRMDPAPVQVPAPPPGLPQGTSARRVTSIRSATGPSWEDRSIEPRELVQALAEEQGRGTNIPTMAWPTAAWSGGFATVPGNVRRENQDYGVVYTVGNSTFIAVADGCGAVLGRAQTGSERKQ